MNKKPASRAKSAKKRKLPGPRVVAEFSYVGAANRYLAEHPDEGVLSVVDGIISVAKLKDLGESPKPCRHDTDGDGDCHLCHSRGGCLHLP